MRAAAAVVACALASGPAWATEPDTPSGRPWAPSDIAYTLHAWDFRPLDAATATGSLPSLPFHRTGAPGPAILVAGARLPSGVRITGVEIAGCRDASFGAIMWASLDACADPFWVCDNLAYVRLPTGAGCDVVTEPMNAVVDGDNASRSYVVSARVPSGGSLRAVRIFYRKQVSPAPATPTFADVPTTDGRFRFVEALVAAGITGGCGGGLYCPEAPFTRGQMAVFLGVALGLFWAH
jgi:hypothetical protein